MRTLAALVLYVSLAFGGDFDGAGKSWDSINKEGLAAVARADYERAEALFRDSLNFARTTTQSGIAAGNVGAVLHRSGRDTEARTWLEHALVTWKDGGTAAQLAVLYRYAGDYEHSEQVARAALKDLSLDPEAKATLLNTVADILREEARDGEARVLFDQAWKVKDAPWRCRVESLVGLAALDRDAGKWQDAIQLARDHDDRSLEAIAVRGLGENWLMRNNSARAEPLLRQALTIFEAGDERSGHQTASTLSALGELYLGDDKPAMAEEVLERALSLDEKGLGPGHPQIGMILQMLADTDARLGRMDQARRYFDRALLIMTARFGDKSAITAAVLVNLGTVEQRANHPAEAGAAYRRALVILEGAAPVFEPLRMSVTARYAQVLKATHHGQEARVLLAQVKGFRGK